MVNNIVKYVCKKWNYGMWALGVVSLALKISWELRAMQQSMKTSQSNNTVFISRPYVTLMYNKMLIFHQQFINSILRRLLFFYDSHFHFAI